MVKVFLKPDMFSCGAIYITAAEVRAYSVNCVDGAAEFFSNAPNVFNVNSNLWPTGV